MTVTDEIDHVHVRKRLPNRRAATSFDFEQNRIRFIVTYSHLADGAVGDATRLIAAQARASEAAGRSRAVGRLDPHRLLGFARTINETTINFTRLVVVHELNTAITAIREKHGPPPIDDGLPGEPDTPFRTIRAIVLTLPLIGGRPPRRSSA
jgi:hypothetical protein